MSGIQKSRFTAKNKDLEQKKLKNNKKLWFLKILGFDLDHFLGTFPGNLKKPILRIYIYIYIYEKSEIDTCEKNALFQTYKVFTIVFCEQKTIQNP